MINSMTGYGQAQGEINSLSCIVEIKTVNSRYFKSNIKLPEVVAFLEEDIDRLLRQNLGRGMVSYVLRLKDTAENALLEIDEASLKGYIEKIDKIISSTQTTCEIDVGSLLMLPGIVSPMSPDAAEAEKIKCGILEITQEAMDKLRQMRSAEGGALAADLQNHCQAISKSLEQIQVRAKEVLVEYHKKLKKRVDELLAGAKLKLDEETLAREVAVFAERSDISEEITRLNSHLQQFEEAVKANEQAGRRLEFLSQEMFREANTIASKASGGDIVKMVVDIKCRIDRIKEQVQNVE